MNEQEKGYKYGKKYMQQFRSVYKNSAGDLIGYTKTGSKQILARAGDRGDGGFHSGWLKAEREHAKTHTTKQRQPNNDFFGSGFSTPKRKLKDDFNLGW